jgi:hypothetical protein
MRKAMAEQQFWQRVVATVNREYERRVRAASLVDEYGASHHVADHGAAGQDEDGEVAVIANVARGTPVARGASGGQNDHGP